jgi:hypothetical protein
MKDPDAFLLDSNGVAYRVIEFAGSYEAALLQIRNYLFGDMVFALYALPHKEHPIAEAFSTTALS